MDGHQRLRAARESGYTHLTALVQTFADAGEEVEYIAGSSRYRRNLTEIQRVSIGVAREEYFAELNAANVGGRPRESGKEPPPNLAEVSKPSKESREDEEESLKKLGSIEPNLGFGAGSKTITVKL